jgi:hypothetical protein
MRRRWALVAGVTVLALLALVLLAPSAGSAPGSSLSASATGWLAARTYLEQGGDGVAVLDRPLDADEIEGGALTLIAPFQRPFEEGQLGVVDEHLRRGGVVIYGYGGEAPGFAEEQLRENLDLARVATLRGGAPLTPAAWWRFHGERWTLEPAPGSGLGEVDLPALEQAPSAPSGADVLVRAPGDESVPLVFAFERRGGRVLVLPAAALENAAIARAANLELLEWLRREAGGLFRFDELRHGVLDAALVRRQASKGWNLFLAQLIALYLAALWALGRSFGPRWREQPTRHGSIAVFLRQVGQLHARLGHHRAAAKLLVERARQLDQNLPAHWTQEAEAVEAPGDFLRLSRELVKKQNPGR